MDLKRGLTFVTSDPEWGTKVLIGTLISFVPILNFAAVGYTLDTIRNVYHGRETPLPEWNDFGGQFVRGLLAVLIEVLWALPLIVVSCVLFAIVGGSLSVVNSEEAAAALGGVFLCLMPLIALGSFALTPFLMIAITRYGVTNQFSEAMPGPVFREVRTNFRPWLVILAVLFGFSVVSSVITACTFGFGILLFFPLVFYLQLVAAHWYAQAHRTAAGSIAAPPSMV